MEFRLESHDGRHQLFAESHLGQLHEHVFTVAYWQVRGSLGEVLGGRGSAWRIHEDDRDWVLRNYRRGGVVRHLVQDWYFYTGLRRTRPWREFQLLGELRERGMPVPVPVAAQVVHGTLGYRGSLITETLPGTSLAALVESGEPSASQWQAVGRCIRRLHDEGAWHADLNAHNILLDEDDASIIDWDRGRIRFQDTAWRESNLARLERSLRKVTGDESGRQTARGWQLLREAYEG